MNGVKLVKYSSIGDQDQLPGNWPSIVTSSIKGSALLVNAT